MAELRAESVGHAARLLHGQLAHAQGLVSASVLDLAEAVMAAGVACAEDPDALGMLKRYLPGLLKSLSSHTAGAGRCAVYSHLHRMGLLIHFNYAFQMC